MQNSFKKINEIIDNLLIISAEKSSLPKIEKDILLEKLRKAYLQCQLLEEVEMPVNEQNESPVPPVEKVDEAEAPEYEVNQGMTDDVDLFFDTDHESYGAPGFTPELEPALELKFDSEPAVTPKAEPKTEPKVEPKPEPKIEAKPEPKVEVKPEPAPAPKVEPKPEPKPTPQPSQKAPKPEEVIAPEALDGHDEDDLLQFIPQKSAPKTEPAPKAEDKPTPRSLNDLFNKQQEDRSLGTQFQHAKVGDLTKAISINDKFTFIKELFNNKGEEFSAAIQQLNQCANMDEAFDCLEGLKKKYYWDSTATAYLSLCDLLRRKYI